MSGFWLAMIYRFQRVFHFCQTCIPRWKNPYSARVHLFHRANNAHVGDCASTDIHRCLPCQKILKNYLSMGETSKLKTPTLPSKPLRMTSMLNGRAYVAAGPADGALHMTAVLQAYQADLLKVHYRSCSPGY